MEKKIINKNEKEYQENKLEHGDVIRPLYNKIHHRVLPNFTKHSLLAMYNGQELYITLTNVQNYQLMKIIMDGNDITHCNLEAYEYDSARIDEKTKLPIKCVGIRIQAPITVL